MSPNGDADEKIAQKNVCEAIFRMIHDGGKEHWHLSLLPRVSPPDPTSSDDLPINGGGDGESAGEVPGMRSGTGCGCRMGIAPVPQMQSPCPGATRFP